MTKRDDKPRKGMVLTDAQHAALTDKVAKLLALGCSDSMPDILAVCVGVLCGFVASSGVCVAQITQAIEDAVTEARQWGAQHEDNRRGN